MPSLTQFQGPSLCVVITSEMHPDDIMKFHNAGITNGIVRHKENILRNGFGFSNSYHLGDLLQVVSGSSAHFYDPSGKNLLTKFDAHHD